MVISSKAEAESIADVSLQLHEMAGCRGEGEQRQAMASLLNKAGVEGKHHECAASGLCRSPWPRFGPVPSSYCPQCQHLGVLGDCTCQGPLPTASAESHQI